MKIAILLLALLAAPQQAPPELRALMLHAGKATVTSAAWDCWSQGYSYKIGDKDISVRRNERATTSDEWKLSENVYTTSFVITSVASRDGGDDLFVAGISEDGKSVIERWTFAERNGRWHHIPPTLQPVGTPMPTYQGTTEIKGGTWTEPPARHPSPNRTVIYQSSVASCVRSVQADPEGRFILFVEHATSNLYRIRLDQPSIGAPEQIFTPAEIPALAVIVALNCAHHTPTAHRLWIGFEPKMDLIGWNKKRVLLWDNDNDGNIDANATMTSQQFTSATGPGAATTAPWTH